MSSFKNNAYGKNYATGGGGSGGGGFFDRGSQGGSQAAGGGGGGGGSKFGGNQTLRPVTILQISNATQAHEEADWMIDNQTIHQLTFVGFVRSVVPNPTNKIYQVSDGTGAIEVRAWHEPTGMGGGEADEGGEGDGGDSESSKEIPLWSYVRVIGTIQEFSKRRYINKPNISLITDANEIFFHKLEAMHAHQNALKKKGGNANGAAPYGRDGDGDDRMKLETKRYEDVESPVERKIMQTIDALHDACDDTVGINIRSIAARFTSLPESDVRAHVESLVSNGYLYTTQDDDHVLSTGYTAT